MSLSAKLGTSNDILKSVILTPLQNSEKVKRVYAGNQLIFIQKVALKILNDPHIKPSAQSYPSPHLIAIIVYLKDKKSYFLAFSHIVS